jgi:hypothetical protein
VHVQERPLGDGADRRCLDLPLLGEGEDLRLVLGRDDGEHAFLGLRHEDLAGGHVMLAEMHPVEVDVHPHAAVAGDLGRRARDAGCPEVLDGDDEAPVVQLEARLDQLLLLERVADLDVRALLLVALLERCRREDRCTADSVATRCVPEEDGEVPDARCRGEYELILLEDPERHDVDEGVLREPVSELDLAAEGGDTHGVAVSGDAGHDALEEVPVAGVVERTEAERVPDGDRACAHREDVAQDASDARGRTLVRLDVARVVVALDPNAASHPSPRSTTPAFSPGPTTTHGWSEEKRPRCARDDLYEQCSDHITEYMASSAAMGSRPRISMTCWYSSSVIPRRTCAGVSTVIRAGLRSKPRNSR